jgi:hypothetical protein
MLAAISSARTTCAGASRRFLHASTAVWTADLEARFVAAKAAVQKVPTVDNMDKLQLYALYKQATAGKNESPAPGMLDFVVSPRIPLVKCTSANCKLLLCRARQSGTPGQNWGI